MIEPEPGAALNYTDFNFPNFTVYQTGIEIKTRESTAFYDRQNYSI